MSGLNFGGSLLSTTADMHWKLGLFGSFARMEPVESLNDPPSSKHDPTIRFFWLVMAIHVLAYLCVCLWTQPNMPLDMVEMLFWGQQWQLGYHKHPPLPAWITAGAWSLGGNHPWLIYLVSQLTVVTTFWAVWQFAREQLSPNAALCSVLVLEGCYYCTFMINDVNNTIVTRPFWALAVLFLYRAIVREQASARNMNWLLAGVSIGLGMLSKYYIGILVLSMLCIAILFAKARKHLSKAGPWITTVVALAIFAPHAVWIFDNDFVTFQYVLQRSGTVPEIANSWVQHITSPADFLVRQLPAVIPVLILATPLFLCRSRKGSHEKTDSRIFFQRYLAVVFFGPIVIYFLIGLLTGSPLRSMWGGPLFSFLGVVLFTFVALPEDQKKVNKIIRDSLCVGVVMVIALAGRNIFGPSIQGKLSRVHFPGRQLAEVVNTEWSARYDRPLPSVGGTLFEAGCAGVYSPNRINVYGSMSHVASPWLDDDALRTNGGMIVWDPRSRPPLEDWQCRFPTIEILEPAALPGRLWLDSNPIEVGIAILHPESSAFARQKDSAPSRVSRKVIDRR